MDISEATALVTGANRGIGRHIAAQLLERGAKVYAAARRPAVDEDLDVDQCAALRDDHDRNTEPVTDETDNKQDLTRQLPE